MTDLHFNPLMDALVVRASNIDMVVLQAHHESLDATTGAYLDRHGHVEFGFVMGLARPFQKLSKYNAVFGDGDAMALAGHNAGPAATMHLPNPYINNALLPVILLTSSRSPAISASNRYAGGSPVCAYSPLIAPYYFCNDKEKEEEPEDTGEEPKTAFKKGLAKRKKAAAKTLRDGKPSLGFVELPTGGQTVVVRLSWFDYFSAAIAFLSGLAVGAAWGRVSGWFPRIPSAKTQIAHFREGDLVAASVVVGYATAKAVSKQIGSFGTSFISGAMFRSKQIDILPYKVLKYDLVKNEFSVWRWNGLKWEASAAAPTPVKVNDADGGEQQSAQSQPQATFWEQPEEESESSETTPKADDGWIDPLEEPSPTPSTQSNPLEEFFRDAPHVQ